MEILGKIFNSTARVKIMRLFLTNNAQVFEAKDIAHRSRVNPALARKEISLLSSAGFVKKSKKGFIFNQAFAYAAQMEDLLAGKTDIDKGALAKKFKNIGKIKLLIVSGAFIKNKEARVDILIVGDKINKKKVEESVAKLEAELGTELAYAIFDTAEFIYRFNMYDKLIHDILDFPHEAVLESKELSTQSLKKS